MQPSSNPRVRFRIWQIVIALILLGMPVWLHLGHREFDRAALLGWCVLSSLSLAIWILLRTTPPNAIKVPVSKSQRIILLGTLWLHAHAIIAWNAQPIAWRIGFAVLMLAAAGLLLNVCARTRISPWYVAIIAWHPLMILDTSPLTRSGAIAYLLVALALWTWRPASLAKTGSTDTLRGPR